ECEAGRDLLARALGVAPPDVRSALSRLPALGSFEPLGAPRPGALVLLEGPGRKPLLALGRYGLGRTAILATDETWRWAFTGEGPHEGGRAAHAGFFRELVRAVAAPAAGLAGPIDVTVAKEIVEPGEHVVARVSVAPVSSVATVQCFLDGQPPHPASPPLRGGEEIDVDLPLAPETHGELVLTVRALDAAGKEIAREDKVLCVRHSGREERVGEPADAALLARIADAGGGKAFAEEDVSRGDARRVLAAALEARRRLDRVQAPLATGPGHVLLLALLLSAAWGLRRGAGLR
ncbi:MAG TPA: hypothetical protein VFF73_29900, partial [Planctomycetota bacterium]|nr:hypothetical protein [Planctomycetota bacterium]